MPEVAVGFWVAQRAPVPIFTSLLHLIMTFDFIIRLLVAALMGGAIGLEREYRAKEAGFRTHFLVALGSALFMVLSGYGFDGVLDGWHAAEVRLDPSRIAAQVVSGIGFIGAGTIIFQKHVVRGLTTAAGLWVTASIGMTCGAGLFALGGAATVLVLLGLEAMNVFLNRFGSRNFSVSFTAPSEARIREVLDRLQRRGAEIENYHMEIRQTSLGSLFVVTMDLKVKRRQFKSRVPDVFKQFDGVTLMSIE